ncbi:MAG TPA: hypothetical protein VFA33_13495 [Bryobacteraceae bacterium]|nr:hypothetical protein [Bryobacteraceae bacterium]
MSDRGVLFLFSLVMVLASLAAAAWLLATRQAAHIDGLFLLLVCLLVAFSFSCYLRFLVRQVLKELAAVQKAPEKPKSLAA